MLNDVLLLGISGVFVVSSVFHWRIISPVVLGTLLVFVARGLILMRLSTSAIPLPTAFASGIALSVPLFFLSLWLTEGFPRGVAAKALSNLKQFAADGIFPGLFVKHFIVAFSEELVWRVCLQGVLIQFFPWWIAVVSVSVLFFAAHLPLLMENRRQVPEFLGYSLLLGSLFEITHSFVLVVTLHAARNIAVLLYRAGVLAPKRPMPVAGRRMSLVLVSIVVISSACGHALADSRVDNISLSKAITTALADNRGLQSKQKEADQAAQHLIDALRSWWPSLTLNIDSSYYKRENFSRGASAAIEIAPGVSIPAGLLNSTGQEYFKSSFGVGLQQLLWDDGAVRGQVMRAAAELRLKQAELVKEKQDFVRKVADAYYDCLIGSQQIQIRKLEQKVREREKAASGRNIYFRRLADVEKQIDLLEATNQFDADTRDLSVKKITLLELMGLSPEGESQLELAMPDGSPGDISPVAVSNNIDIEIARARVDVLRGQLVIDSSGNRPRAEFTSDFNYFRTNERLRETFRELDRAWSAGVRLSWSFFDQGKTPVRVLAGSLGIEGSEDSLKALQDKLAVEAEQLEAAIKNQNALAQLMEKKLDLLNQRSAVALRSSAAGLISDVQMTNHHLDIARTQARLLEIQKTLLSSTLRLKELNTRRDDHGKSS